MKRISFFLLGLLALVSCDPNNGDPGTEKWQSINCNPYMLWLQDFYPFPESPEMMPSSQRTVPPHPYIEFFERYQNADLLRITVVAGNQVEILHHAVYPCSYRIEQHVELTDSKIVLWETERKPPFIVKPCICGADITSSISVAHLDYHTLVLSDYDMEFPIHLYEGMDTLIIIRTDIPFEPMINVDVSGAVRDDKSNNLESVQMTIHNKSGEIADTVYTDKHGMYSARYAIKGCEDDTLTITATARDLGLFYDTCKTVHIAFADMAYDTGGYDYNYYVSQYFKFVKNTSFNPLYPN
jgi:hypothetical protein